MDTTNNELVVYSKFNGDIATAVQSTASIDEIRPENRVVIEGGMYIASCADLKLEPKGFLGQLSLAYYEDRKEEQAAKEKTLVSMVMRKLLKKTDKPDMEHDGKKYNFAWRSWSGKEWIIYNAEVQPHVIGKMKTEVVAGRNILLANNFLSLLFNPVIDSLLEIHRTLGRF